MEHPDQPIVNEPPVTVTFRNLTVHIMNAPSAEAAYKVLCDRLGEPDPNSDVWCDWLSDTYAVDDGPEVPTTELFLPDE